MSLHILPTILELMSGSASKDISGKTGLTSTQVTTAATIALPLLIQAMSKNTKDEQGAESLAKAVQKDHDGSILSNLGDYIQKSDFSEGNSILKHLIGSNKDGIAAAVGKMAGIDEQKSTQILAILAPIVLGVLGQYMKKQKLSPQELAANLAEEETEVQQSAPDAANLFRSLIDTNGDGQVADDVLKIGGQLLGAFLKNR